MKKIITLALMALLLTSFEQKEITWVAIGDSITYLNDHLDETGNRVTKGFLTRVVEKLPHIKYINQGHNGWTAVRVAREIEKLNVPYANVYTVLLGTNDWWAGLTLGTPDDYKNNTGIGTVSGAYRVIIDKLKALNPKARIILMTPMQRGDFVYLRNMKNNAWGSYKEKNGQMLEQFAQSIKQIGESEGFDVIDLYHNERLTQKQMVRFKRLKDPVTGEYKNYKYPSFISAPFNPATDEYPYPPEAINMTYDGLHPSDKGNQVIANMLVRVLKKGRPLSM